MAQLGTLKTTKMQTEREIIKFASDAKIGTNPVMFTPQEAAVLQQIGFPLPAGMKKPASQFGMDEHMGMIESMVQNGLDLPPDNEIANRGFDVNWLKNNWMQYRNFFRQRQMNQLMNAFGIDPTQDAPEIIKNLAKNAAKIFF
jgi:hypothetical protein